ncbi:MAG: aquaporin [Candidatus Marsarchaeota archaeon]|nr:aquaporin [Candidatus Marsarchaeota archaeon]
MAKDSSLKKRMLAEFIGTFLFVFVGAGSAVAAQSFAPGNAALLVAALANGIGLAMAISYALNTSGGHINPAVTIGIWAAKMIRGIDAIGYIAAQVVGATIAGLVLVWLLPAALGGAANYGAPALGSGTGVLQGIVIEAIMTFFLVSTVFATIVDKRFPKFGGLFVGLVVVADVLIGGPFTGAAMNPARAIGPQLAAGFLANWYVYWIGPIVGGLVAALIYKYLFMDKR